MSSESLEKLLDGYDFEVPPGQIAQRPASPRDSSRLLAFNRESGEINHAHFRDLPDLLPPGALLVLNETKVIPARLRLTKTDTGGELRALFVGKLGDGTVECLVDRRVRPGQTLRLDRGHAFEVVALERGRCRMRPSFPISRLDALLERRGHAPLPPYIKRHGLSRAELLKKYQTVFAKNAGSVAAPTASLHFTPRVLKRLSEKGIDVVKVTLHVSLGTFAPLTDEHVETGLLHEERWEVSPAAARRITAAKQTGRPVIPVGTTALRAVESAAENSGAVVAGKGATRLFIQPGYRFRVADGLLTNFHVPRSSLLMLVAALVGRVRLMSLYRLAVAMGYRLFSFGDAMLIT